MRGLTLSERACLLAPPDEACDPEIINYLVARGLLELVATDETGEYYRASCVGELVAKATEVAK